MSGTDDREDTAPTSSSRNLVVRWAQRIQSPGGAFQGGINLIADRHLHGGVPSGRRTGAALRATTMVGLAPGLLTPDHFQLHPRDVPANATGLHDLLFKLIAGPSKGHWAVHAQTAVLIATKKLVGVDGVSTLVDHVNALLDLRTNASEDHFLSAVLGDFTWGAELHSSTPPELRDAFTRALVRQRIIWSAGHVHRVAAHANISTTRFLVPWYYHPFMRTWTATEYMALQETVASTITRIFGAAEVAEAHGREKVSVGGRPGAVLEAGRLIASPVEAALSPDERILVLATRETIGEQSEIYRNHYHALRMDPTRNNQQSIYEARYGLSDIGALYFAAYRFAQDEAAMAQILANPERVQALFDLRLPAFPPRTFESNDEADAKANRRALHMVAAYRPAVLRDPAASPYVAGDVIAAEDSVAAARDLLGRIGRGDGLTEAEQQARVLFDIDHDRRRASK